MTSHWNAEICLWPFQLRSIANSPRDLNLDCWETRIPWTKTYRYCLRANFESNDSYEPSPSCWKTCGLPDATVSSHGFITSIRTRNDCPGSFEISAWILLTTAKKPNYFCCWAPSAMAFNERKCSIILRTCFNITIIFRIYDYLLEASGFLKR